MVTFGETIYVGTGRAGSGAQVWRMNDFLDWSRVSVDGFGDPANTDAFSLGVFGYELWAGTANWTAGGEVWVMAMLFADGFETGDTVRWSSVAP
jgi:hypothetical protein